MRSAVFAICAGASDSPSRNRWRLISATRARSLELALLADDENRPVYRYKINDEDAGIDHEGPAQRPRRRHRDVLLGDRCRPECRTHQIALGSGESVASRLIMCCSSARKLQLEYGRHSGPPVILLPSTNPKRDMPGRWVADNCPDSKITASPR